MPGKVSILEQRAALEAVMVLRAKPRARVTLDAKHAREARQPKQLAIVLELFNVDDDDDTADADEALSDGGARSSRASLAVSPTPSARRLADSPSAPTRGIEQADSRVLRKQQTMHASLTSPNLCPGRFFLSF